MNLLSAIALLCQVQSPAANLTSIAQIQAAQNACQAELATCVQTFEWKYETDETKLLSCVAKRK